MAPPAKRKTWIIDPSNQIAFVSLNQVMGAFLIEIKTFLETNGYVVEGSSDGTTGGMDGPGTDRWVDATDTVTRFNGAAGAQSWIILKDANDTRILIAYQGATDDICRVSFATSAFTIAATATHQPTHATEQVLASATSVINATASGDRRWHGWVDSSTTPKAFRIAISRANVTASCFGVEDTDKDDVHASVTWNGTWGFFHNPTGLGAAGTIIGFNATTTAKRARLTVAGTPVSAQCYFGMEMYNGITTELGTVILEMQGSLGYPMVPLLLGSSTTSGKGKYGALYDQWLGRMTGHTDGDTYDSKNFVVIGQGAGLVWPWDGSTPIWA